MKVVVTCAGTGGHINPGIAIANILKEREENCEILFIGTKTGLENDLVPKAGYSLKEINDMLNKKSGLEGIAGMNDLRDIDEGFINGEEKVVLAMEMYTNRIVEYVSKYFVKLNGNNNIEK